MLERGEALPSNLAKHWEKLYQPLPSSVLAPLERFLAEVRALEGEQGAIFLGPVQITDHGSFGRKASIQIEANATFMGADVAASTRLLEQLCDRLRAVPRFTVPEVRTSNRGMAWLGASLQVEIEVDLAEAPRRTAAAPLFVPEPGTALVPRINTDASAAGIALRAVAPSKLPGATGWEFVLCELLQDKGSARPLDEELAWLRTLEDLGRLTAVNRVSLERLPTPPGGPEAVGMDGPWYASVALCVQQEP